MCGHTYRLLGLLLDGRTHSHYLGCSGGLASSPVDDRHVDASQSTEVNVSQRETAVKIGLITHH